MTRTRTCRTPGQRFVTPRRCSANPNESEASHCADLFHHSHSSVQGCHGTPNLWHQSSTGNSHSMACHGSHRALLCFALCARLERRNGLGPSHRTQMSGLTSFTSPHRAQAQASHFGLKTLVSSSEAVVSRLPLLKQSTSCAIPATTETPF